MQPQHAPTGLERIATCYPWLLVDLFLLALLGLFLLSYPSLPPELQLAGRGFFVLSLVQFWLAGVHLVDLVQSRFLQSARGYLYFTLRLAAVGAFVWWLDGQGVFAGPGVAKSVVGF